MPQALLDEMGVFIDENLKSGVLIDTAGLQPSSETATVRLSRGKVSAGDVGDAVRRHDQPSTEGSSHPAALR